MKLVHGLLLGSGAAVAAAFGGPIAALATRVAYKLDLRGPGLTIQTACSASLAAAAAKVLANARAAAAKIWVTRMKTPEGGQGAENGTDVPKNGGNPGPGGEPEKPTTFAAAL